MRKSILIPFIVFGFIILPENIFRQEIYESVDERGTINFSDSSASSVITTKEGAARRDGEEVLRRDGMANRPGQEIYKSVDERGTINFSDNPTSSVVTTKKGAAKQDGAEVLKRDEMANRRGQEIYRSVDERGTINFSDGPTSPVITTKRGSAKQEREEILKRNETANRPPMTDSEIKAVLLTMPTWQGSASSPGWGSSGSVRTGRS